MSVDATLAKAAAELREELADENCTGHTRELLSAILDCILTSKPIPKDLQDQYVQYLANSQRQDRYGK